jgi:hypothetical protein
MIYRNKEIHQLTLDEFTLITNKMNVRALQEFYPKLLEYLFIRQNTWKFLESKSSTYNTYDFSILKLEHEFAILLGKKIAEELDSTLLLISFCKDTFKQIKSQEEYYLAIINSVQ